MSTTVSVNDPTALQDAINFIRSNESEVQSFILASHCEGNPNIIALQNKGVGVEALANQLDETQVQYALLRMEEQIDMSMTTKYVYIHW